jgi:hypothetical protein
MALDPPAGLRTYSITDLPAFASRSSICKRRDHSEQARLALKVVRVTAKRIMSEAQGQALAERLKNLPSDAPTNEGSAARNDEDRAGGVGG